MTAQQPLTPVEKSRAQLLAWRQLMTLAEQIAERLPQTTPRQEGRLTAVDVLIELIHLKNSGVSIGLSDSVVSLVAARMANNLSARRARLARMADVDRVG
jgi:hypothetical protein